MLIDVPMPMDYVTLDFVGELNKLEPFGNGNPKPQFAQKNVHFISGRILGANQNVGKYVVKDETGRSYDMIYFGDIEGLNVYMARKYGQEAVKMLYDKNTDDILLSVIYYPEVNEYRGNVSLQMVMKYYM